MNKKDLNEIRIIYDLQAYYGSKVITLSKASFKQLLEYAEKCKRNERK